MNRRLTVIAAGVVLALAGCSPASDDSAASSSPAPPLPVPAPLPAFEFRGLKPDVTTMAAALEAETVARCSESGSCEFAKYGVGDVGTSRSIVLFKAGKFDWFSIKMSPRSFEEMGRTLIGVYGEPCRTDSQQLQNAYGATFSGDEVEWCFAEGLLTLRRHSQNDVTEGELDFFTYREPEPAKAYTSGNL